MTTSSSHHIVVLDGRPLNPGDLSWAPLHQWGTVDIYPATTPDLVIERARQADIVLTNKVVFSAPVIAALPQLRYIGVCATGYNTVDLAAASRADIVVTNAPDYSTQSVAQLVFAHLLNICNHPDHYARLNRSGRWSESPDFCYYDLPSIELQGKVMGIVGLGHIGQAVARIALALGMSVVALTSKPSDRLPAGVRAVSLDQLLSESDVISLHCPLTPDNHHLINASTLARLKPGAILINTARGALVDQDAVAQALADRRLSAYAADVMEQEPPAADTPLLRSPHAYITPHVAWATVQARQRLLDICLDNVRAYLDGHPIHQVNS